MEGTSWTIAGIVASQCGYPLVPVGHRHNNLAITRSFMPKANCLGDMLAKQGYHLSYLGGADLSFAGKGLFFESHGYQSIQGKKLLKEKLEDKNYTNGWGIYDDSLFDMAFEQFQQLSAQDQPFVLTTLTLDTHPPKGIVSKSCHKYAQSDDPMLQSVHCSDQLLKQFIDKIRASDASDNTWIMVMSDHLAMRNSASGRLDEAAARKLFWFVQPPNEQGKRISHQATHFDVTPTLLELMGFEPSGTLGFGRSVLDQAGQVYALGDEKLLTQSQVKQFAKSLWQQQAITLEQGIQISDHGKDVELGGQQFNFRADGRGPLSAVVMEFDEQGELMKLDNYPWNSELESDDFSKLLLNYPNRFYVLLGNADLFKSVLSDKLEKGNYAAIGKFGSPSHKLVKLDTSYQLNPEHLAAMNNAATDSAYLAWKKQKIELVAENEHTMLLYVGNSLGEEFHAQSCGFNACDTFVEVAKQQIKTKQRGINIARWYENKLEWIAYIDGCDKQDFQRFGDFQSFLNKQQGYLLMVMDDSATCGAHQELADWVAGSPFELMASLKMRQPYIAVYDTQQQVAAEAVHYKEDRLKISYRP